MKVLEKTEIAISTKYIRVLDNDVCLQAHNGMRMKNKFEIYKKKVLACMKEMGASEFEMRTVHDATIQNGIKNNWEPKDVAWALLQ